MFALRRWIGNRDWSALAHADGSVMPDPTVEGKLCKRLHHRGRALPIFLPPCFDSAFGDEGKTHGAGEARGCPAGALCKFPVCGVDRRHLIHQDAVSCKLRP